jgi:hypothetical protein
MIRIARRVHIVANHIRVFREIQCKGSRTLSKLKSEKHFAPSRAMLCSATSRCCLLQRRRAAPKIC